MDRESDQIGFDTLEKLTGFPAEIIMKELLGDKYADKSTIELGELRELMASFVDRELLTPQNHE